MVHKTATICLGMGLIDGERQFTSDVENVH